ncbi:hypothetical protein N7532_002444 [Penicillium argentinense]|uniref:Cytochrome P450 n=1 Tax=Penicillium argentinense TaxID=1131581 RepID=A0A9W9KKA1_9EURO|nr:uncharacterized protein N7532_002444 [Penicillium argentinense]KAJ5109799.1 hypothetical protein N7532_002444 [Penicillium argentinense]
MELKLAIGTRSASETFHYEREQRILLFFLDVVDKPGNIFEQNPLFARGIDTIEPENIEAVPSAQFTGCHRQDSSSLTNFGLGLRPPTFAPLMGSGIFTQDGKQWRHSRELLRPQFMTNQLNNSLQIMGVLNNLILCIPEDEEVDLQPLFFRSLLKLPSSY